MDMNGDQEINESNPQQNNESNPQQNNEPTNPATKSQKDKQGDKYTIMLLKERWEEIEILLKRRNTLNLINFVVSSFVILFGIALLYIFWKKNISETVHIITSSVLASSGVLALLNILGQEWKRNKDTVTSLVGVAKKIPLPSEKVFMPALLQIPDELINEELVSRCKDYLKFLDRIKYLINAEKRNGVVVIAILSLYVIITSVISILINSNIIILYINSVHIDFILAISIIIIGCLWLYNVTLSFFERTVEKMLNYTIEPPTSPDHIKLFNSSDHIKMIIYTMKFIFLKPTIEVVITILTYYYIFSKRLYLIDDKKFSLDDYGKVSFFGNDDIVNEYKVRIYGNKKSRRNKYRTIELIRSGIREFKNRLNFYSYILIVYLFLLYVPYTSATFLVYIITKFLPNEGTNTSTSSYDNLHLGEDKEKNLAEILEFGNPMNIAEKYVIYTFILGFRMKTGFQFKIESTEITEKQREEIRSLLCGLVQYSYI
ncbi:20404_t:CDS:1 [Cetraspora pellucida]|uniref:20404_t:CDS:1 n=1 Tax=Cetraspora pellucida TaxID=1433469 RepID=A0A9N9H0J7_9GLOM|nr:20404_t:CDS:1 [Cetraspora pellucida]